MAPTPASVLALAAVAGMAVLAAASAAATGALADTSNMTTFGANVRVLGSLRVDGEATFAGGLTTSTLNGAPLVCGAQFRAKTTYIPPLVYTPFTWYTTGSMLETFGAGAPTVLGDSSGAVIINTPGTYLLSGQFVTADYNGVTQYYRISLFVNGTETAALAAQPNNGPSNTFMSNSFSHVRAYAAGDAVSVRIYQNQGDFVSLPSGGSGVSFAGSTPQTNVNVYSLFRLPG